VILNVLEKRSVHLWVCPVCKDDNLSTNQYYYCLLPYWGFSNTRSMTAHCLVRQNISIGLQKPPKHKSTVGKKVNQEVIIDVIKSGIGRGKIGVEHIKALRSR
jgi:C4-type Zn-finger protein